MDSYQFHMVHQKQLLAGSPAQSTGRTAQAGSHQVGALDLGEWRKQGSCQPSAEAKMVTSGKAVGASEA